MLFTPQLLKFLACCSGEDYLPLQCLDGYFTEAAETAVNESKFIDVLERDGVKVVTMHPLHHNTLRNMLTSSRRPTPSGKNTILISRSYKLKDRFFPLYILVSSSARDNHE